MVRVEDRFILILLFAAVLVKELIKTVSLNDSRSLDSLSAEFGDKPYS